MQPSSAGPPARVPQTGILFLLVLSEARRDCAGGLSSAVCGSGVSREADKSPDRCLAVHLASAALGLMLFGFAGKAPAEHGSALHPLPLAQPRGGLGRGWL